jgi:8-oxo-dGTP diphosphatase
MSLPIIHVAAAAIIDAEGRVLLAQRPEGKEMAGMWEFPGGKIEPGETPEAAMIREIKEEIGLDICSHCFAPLSFVSHAYARFHLVMYLFAVNRFEGIPTPKEGQQLTWKRPQQMRQLAMPAADKPLIDVVADYVSARGVLGG